METLNTSYLISLCLFLDTHVDAIGPLLRQEELYD